MLLLSLHNTSIALWHHLAIIQCQDSNPLVYIQARRTAFKWTPRWEPWDNNYLPPVRFVKMFRLSLMML
ncbi:uncharacterized protein VP01_553g6 [Puccinia sorghi]|uniref:Uncharacterized protein n=1 Tax=Puccinia sorghi TaxID=27349 RepID=A0A0L6UJB1_9BASI|nr:uncharacterized protein VP01_553g6 [Puccinia sorghi]